jgi:primosomal protein N'
MTDTSDEGYYTCTNPDCEFFLVELESKGDHCRHCGERDDACDNCGAKAVSITRTGAQLCEECVAKLVLPARQSLSEVKFETTPDEHNPE